MHIGSKIPANDEEARRMDIVKSKVNPKMFIFPIYALVKVYKESAQLEGERF